MVLGQHRTRPAVWAFALFLAALLHIGAILAERALRPFDPSPVHAHESKIIEVVFTPEPESVPRSEPTFFSELPPENADQEPERADFLSNVASRARDDVPGGTEEGLPRLEGRSESPHVGMEPGPPDQPAPEVGSASQPATASSSEEEPEPDAAEPTQDEVREELPPAEDISERPPSLMQQLREARLDENKMDSRNDGVSSKSPEAAPRTAGRSDIFQDPMSNPEGNVALPGGISLNTTAWEYAPWLQKFRRDLERRWRAPYAYYLGVLDGWTLVEMEIAPSGELIRLEVLEEKGHESLRNASLAALRGVTPCQPLPDHFPEDSLILRIKLIYPGPKG